VLVVVTVQTYIIGSTQKNPMLKLFPHSTVSY